jgi:ribonucleoside-triphosphate reductase (thioredoxin)
MPEENRRETWEETVSRWWSYFTDKAPLLSTRPDIKEAILNLEVLPSMRGLMTAGPALDKDNTALYNCAYMEINNQDSFGELMYILMCGTGVGYSVESRCITKLPVVPATLCKDWGEVITVGDSREGWCDALKSLVSYLYLGIHPKWDVSLVRGSGERLKTFGGRASGPAPLEETFRFITQVFYKAKGRHLTALECHDICCKIAQSVIVGGVRRSAMISLSDLSDREMATCKSGAWWEASSHRSLANNSAVYNDRPSMGQFMEEWTDLYNSHSGERGIVNRKAMNDLATKAGRNTEYSLGTNPCSEIILRPMQFCNLSTVVVRETDTIETLNRKIEQATVIGTVQSMFTYFPYLNPDWKKNCTEERLLGVSMTGIFDNKMMSGKEGQAKLKYTLEVLKETAEYTNLTWSHQLGIEPSKSICCIKPEGTTSCLANASSGLHPRYSEFYFRRVRLDKKDPLYQLMKDQNVLIEDCVVNPASTAVLTFPQKAPIDTITSLSLGAMEHLKLWMDYQQYYCHHKPSITVSYTEDEFLEVGNWVWKNFDKISGIAFLPKSDHTYAQAPFEAIDPRTYNMTPKIAVDFSKLKLYEMTDSTTSSHDLACSAGGCELK